MSWYAALAGLTSAGGNLYDQSRNRQIAKQNINMQREINKENIALQYDFAKHGISWKVEDAIKSGLHPLAALGAQVSSAIPSSIAPRNNYQSKTGQNISGTINTLIQTKKDLEIIQSMKLDNQLKKLEIKNASKKFKTTVLPLQDETGHIIGDNISGSANYQPPTLPTKQKFGIESGFGALESYQENADGYLWLMPSDKNADKLESSWFDQFKYIGTRLARFGKAFYYWSAPHLKGAKEHRQRIRDLRPKEHRKGFHWRFNHLYGFKEYPNSKGKALYEIDVYGTSASFGSKLGRANFKY